MQRNHVSEHEKLLRYHEGLYIVLITADWATMNRAQRIAQIDRNGRWL